MSQRGHSGEGRTRAESANVLFKGRDYCRLVVSSHFALIDRKFQEGIGFPSCMHRVKEHGATAL